MTSGTGASLGAAVYDLLGINDPKTVKRKMAYLLSRHTGATEERVAQLLGARLRDVRVWAAGSTMPKRTNQGIIDEVYRRFWEINHDPTYRRTRGEPPAPALSVGDEPFRVDGRGVFVADQWRGTILFEVGEDPRDWAAVFAATEAAISADNGSMFVEAMGPPVNYLELRPSTYNIATV